MKLLFILLAASALLGAPLEHVTLVNAGNPLVDDGASYVGPYTLNLNGHDLLALCIDFDDESKPGDQWAVYVNRIADGIQDSYHPSALTEYEEESYLYTMILRPGADRVDIQHAAWALTDADYRSDAAAEHWIALAKENYSHTNPANFEILSEVPGGESSRRQEFLTSVTVPEPKLLHLVIGLAMIGLALLGRRRG